MISLFRYIILNVKEFITEALHTGVSDLNIVYLFSKIGDENHSVLIIIPCIPSSV